MLMLLTSRTSTISRAITCHWSVCTPIASCLFTTSIEASSTSSSNNDNNEKRRRRRHRFSLSEDIPSFQEFQQRQRVRSLYRQFIRLVRTLSASTEMKEQIRREFRVTQPDLWHAQRAVSEGTRRYKEIAAMVANAVTNEKTAQQKSATNNTNNRDDDDHEDTPVSTGAWPWQQGNYQKDPPNHFPRR